MHTFNGFSFYDYNPTKQNKYYKNNTLKKNKQKQKKVVKLSFLCNDPIGGFVHLSPISTFEAFRMCIYSFMTCGDGWFHLGEVLDWFGTIDS